MRNCNQDGWPVFIGICLTTTGTFVATLFVNILLGAIVGSISGWMLSWTFLGSWITDGLGMMNAKSGELYKFGAAVGFLTGFLKFSFTAKKQ